MKWFDVAKSLPDHHNMVLVWYEPTKSDGIGRDPNKPGWWGMAFWSRTEGWGWTRGDGNRANDVFGTITHWMEAPVGPNAVLQ